MDSLLHAISARTLAYLAELCCASYCSC